MCSRTHMCFTLVCSNIWRVYVLVILVSLIVLYVFHFKNSKNYDIEKSVCIVKLTIFFLYTNFILIDIILRGLCIKPGI